MNTATASTDIATDTTTLIDTLRAQAVTAIEQHAAHKAASIAQTDAEAASLDAIVAAIRPVLGLLSCKIPAGEDSDGEMSYQPWRGFSVTDTDTCNIKMESDTYLTADGKWMDVTCSGERGERGERGEDESLPAARVSVARGVSTREMLGMRYYKRIVYIITLRMRDLVQVHATHKTAAIVADTAAIVATLTPR